MGEQSVCWLQFLLRVNAEMQALEENLFVSQNDSGILNLFPSSKAQTPAKLGF